MNNQDKIRQQINRYETACVLADKLELEHKAAQLDRDSQARETGRIIHAVKGMGGIVLYKGKTYESVVTSDSFAIRVLDSNLEVLG